MELKEAIKELRKNEKKNFDQSIDLIVNLKGIDTKRETISTVVPIPHKIKDKKVCGFLSEKSDLVKTITLPEFSIYKEKKELKPLVKNYDFFIAGAKLMPSVATTFGKVLGPTGKMPSPQLGVLMTEDSNSIKQLLAKIEKSIKIRLKEPSAKISIGKESMKDEEIIENVEAVYNGLVNVLPTKKENVKSILIKMTMTKPIKVEMK
jgi:large subunit ribosomal protein L1